jgi:hypothetical protein
MLTKPFQRAFRIFRSGSRKTGKRSWALSSCGRRRRVRAVAHHGVERAQAAHLDAPDYDLKHGYTYSLILLFLPLVALICWYQLAKRSETDRRLQTLVRQVLWNALLTAFIFVAFDALFATILFDFPTRALDSASISGLYVDRKLLDVLDGFGAVLLRANHSDRGNLLLSGGVGVLRGMYIWASEDFLSLYTMKHEDYVKDAKAVNRCCRSIGK